MNTSQTKVKSKLSQTSTFEDPELLCVLQTTGKILVHFAGCYGRASACTILYQAKKSQIYPHGFQSPSNCTYPAGVDGLSFNNHSRANVRSSGVRNGAVSGLLGRPK